MRGAAEVAVEGDGVVADVLDVAVAEDGDERAPVAFLVGEALARGVNLGVAGLP